MLINSSLYYTTAKQPLGQRAYYEPVLVMPNQKNIMSANNSTHALLDSYYMQLPVYRGSNTNIPISCMDLETERGSGLPPPPGKIHFLII